MHVSVESVGNLERRMTLRVPTQHVEGQIGGRLREIARTAKIKGFRPGKVPAKVIEQRYGAQVRSEVVDELLQKGFDQGIRENELRLAGAPRIEPSPEAGTDELAFVAVFEVVPDFGDIDVAGLQVLRNTAEVTEDDIDRMIENLRLQRRSWTLVNRAAQSGDAADVETWSVIDGERLPAEGAERGVTVIGSGAMFADIENALIGMNAGDEKSLSVNFPENWRVPQLAGKHAAVHLKIEQISEPFLPEVDAEFIKSFGVKSADIAQFRTEIRNNLERELKGALMNRLRREVGEQLIVAYAHVEMPAGVVENEARAMLAQSVEQARRQGHEIEAPAEAYRDFIEPARKRITVALLVGEIARRNQLTLDPKRLNETLRLIASTYEEPQQVIDLYRNDRQLMSSLQNRVMEEQVIDWIAERATHTDTPLSFQEAIAPQ
ncbi:MAG: trigger factor [Lysobacteraceae bacterium]